MYSLVVRSNLTNKSSNHHKNRSTRFSTISTGIAPNTYRLQTHSLKWAILAALCLLLLPAISLAAQVTLQWDPNDPTPDGYCVYQRTTGGTYNYNNPVWPTDGQNHTETSCTISGLIEGQTYYFVVRAHVGGVFSGDSNEASYQVPVSQPPQQNQTPVAEAGTNQSAQAGTSVVIDGSGSNDPDGDALSYQWIQSSGPTVTLNGATSAVCTFTAPNVATNTTLSFELTVSDGSGGSDSDTCLVLVSPAQQEPDNDNDGIPDAQDPDDDNDGMPDVWENLYGLNPFSNDAGADADNDGVTNIEEYQAGTNPTVGNGNQAPAQPEITSPNSGETGLDTALWLTASAYDDPDPSDDHKQTQWQIFKGQTPVMDRVIAKKQLNKMKVPRMVLDPSTWYSVRVRYYDNNSEPSQWSNAVSFKTAQDGKDKNNNHIPDSQEVSTHTDMNGDGTPDVDQEATIKSVKTYDNQYLIGVSVEDDTKAIEVECAESVDPMTLETPPPVNDKMAYGLLGYRIQVSHPGDSVATTIYLSDPVDAQTPWACYDGVDGWKDCSADTEVDADGFMVQRNLKDGGAEDADGTANGVIVDMSGPGVAGVGSSESSGLDQSDGGSAASGGGGGGGCFIGSIFGSR